MKVIFLASLLAFSSSSFAALANNGAVDSLTSVLSVGVHVGTNFSGECKVIVSEVNYPDHAVSVTVASDTNTVTKLVSDDDDYVFRKYRNEFIQTTTNYIDSDKTAYVQHTIRTINADFNKLYVTTAYQTVYNREVNEDAAECVIDL